MSLFTRRLRRATPQVPGGFGPMIDQAAKKYGSIRPDRRHRVDRVKFNPNAVSGAGRAA
jgi:hypothetical protein